MGNFRPLSTKCWIKYLLEMGFKLKRTKGSHHQYTKPGKRTIPVWENEKQIPSFHLKCGCETIGVTLEDLYSWAEKNC